MELIKTLEDWYEKQCDGSWEHDSGIKIQTLDNPGWLVNINLVNTDLANKSFDPKSKDVPKELIDQAIGKVKPPFIAASPTSDDWYHCYVKDGRFSGVGSSHRLGDILTIFLDWSK